jgi:hypothetical protein
MSRLASHQREFGGGRDRRAAAWVLCGLVFFMALFWKLQDAAQTTPAGKGAMPVAAQPRPTVDADASLRNPASAKDATPAPGADGTAAKPVVIGVVTPWGEIARKPQYQQANTAERKAIRDQYWLACVEAQIPPMQRAAAYEMFVRNWTTRETASSGALTRITSEPPYPQAAAPSPVNAQTMRQWCGR